MKRKLIVLLGIIGLIIFLFFYLKSDNNLSHNEPKIINTKKFQNGDLIFHISKSEQSEAIQLATKSEYSHCGLIYKKENDFFVVEAIQPVSLTPLDEWIARGEKGHYVVKRLKHADQILTPDILKKMKMEGEKFIGKNYDFNFNWNDDKIYCSACLFSSVISLTVSLIFLRSSSSLTHLTIFCLNCSETSCLSLDIIIL